MRVALYCRVSTEGQMDRYGLGVQEADLRKWASRNGHRVVAVERDAGVSGTHELPDRPALAECFRLLREGRVDAFAVARLDRLARDLILQEQLLAEVRRLGGRILSAADGEQGVVDDDPADPSRRLIRQILGAVSEYERALVRLRLMSGRARKAEAGGYAGGAPPFGQQAVHRKLEPLADEQATLARIRELRSKGLSLRDLSDQLSSEGLRPKRGHRWHPESLRRVLARG